MVYRYFIELAYNGSAYAGWQIQPNAITIQQWVQNALATTIGIKEGVTGCGRTDAGVSAKLFYAHFDSNDAFTTSILDNIVFRLNRFLPQDIVVSKIIPVIPGAHARFSALSREYEYLIIRTKDPFRYHQAYSVHGDLDVERMNLCAAMLIGHHDFQCFCKANTQVNNYYCDIQHAFWIGQNHMLRLTIKADRFLRNMVRAIVGTMIDVGRGKITVEQFQQIIESHDRSEAGYSVPARGLTLTDIRYPNEIFSEEPVFFSPECSDKIISHYYTDSKFHKRTGNKTNK